MLQPGQETDRSKGKNKADSFQLDSWRRGAAYYESCQAKYSDILSLFVSQYPLQFYIIVYFSRGF